MEMWLYGAVALQGTLGAGVALIVNKVQHPPLPPTLSLL